MPVYIAAISNDNLYRVLKTIANCKTEKASRFYAKGMYNRFAVLKLQVMIIW
jgi:hypothetical protein